MAGNMPNKPTEDGEEKGVNIVPFEDKGVRRVWDAGKELWYFAVADILAVLTKSKNPAVYWRVLKQRLVKEGSEQTVTNCNGLKMRAADGKMRVTDVADTETMLRIIQSVPSPNAEPLKRWLAKVGFERIEEIKDPEKAIHRAVATYAQKGYNDEWIGRRLRSIEIRNELTREWNKRGVANGKEFAILTNEVYAGWAGMTSRDYRELKGLKDQNLRDHMSSLELVLTMLAEATTAEIARTSDAQGFDQNQTAAQKGGRIAGGTRNEIERTTGKNVISKDNHLPTDTDKKSLP